MGHGVRNGHWVICRADATGAASDAADSRAERGARATGCPCPVTIVRIRPKIGERSAPAGDRYGVRREGEAAGVGAAARSRADRHRHGRGWRHGDGQVCGRRAADVCRLTGDDVGAVVVVRRQIGNGADAVHRSGSVAGPCGDRDAGGNAAGDVQSQRVVAGFERNGRAGGVGDGWQNDGADRNIHGAGRRKRPIRNRIIKRVLSIVFYRERIGYDRSSFHNRRAMAWRADPCYCQWQANGVVHARIGQGLIDVGSDMQTAGDLGQGAAAASLAIEAFGGEATGPADAAAAGVSLTALRLSGAVSTLGGMIKAYGETGNGRSVFVSFAVSRASDFLGARIAGTFGAKFLPKKMTEELNKIAETMYGKILEKGIDAEKIEEKLCQSN